MSEVGEQEKIDIIVWKEGAAEYISEALSPTKVGRVVVDENNKKAKVIVPEDQLSIAIGKGGQNVRLASKLTGYELDIESDRAQAQPTPEVSEPEIVTTELPKQPRLKKKSDLENSLLEAIEEHGE
jgi:N utilization substance protein A